MGYQIIIKAGKRRYKKLLGLALGFVAALHKKGRPLMMEASVGDDALIYTRGKRVLAFAKRWLAWWRQEPAEGYLDRLGAPGIVQVSGDVRNVLIKAFKNGLLISIRHPDGTWGSADRSASCDEVVIPEFQAQTLAPGWYRVVIVVKTSDDGKKICLLANTVVQGSGFPYVPVTLTYDGTWQATVSETGALSYSPVTDLVDFQTVVYVDNSGDFKIWSCRDTDTWYSASYELVLRGSETQGRVMYGAADGVVMYTAQNYAPPTDYYDAAVLQAAVFYVGGGTVTETFNTGPVYCHGVPYVQGYINRYYVAGCRLDRDPTIDPYPCGIYMRVPTITAYVPPGGLGYSQYNGTVQTTAYGVGPGGAVTTLAQETYSGNLLVLYNGNVYAVNVPTAGLEPAGYYDPAATFVYGTARTAYYRGANGAWGAGLSIGQYDSYVRLAPNLRVWTNYDDSSAYAEWNGGSLYGSSTLASVYSYRCLPHGTFGESRVMDGTLVALSVRHSDDEWDSAVLVRGSDGAYTTVCQVSGAEIQQSNHRVLPAANPTHSVVAVLWAPEEGTALLDIYWKQGSAYERIYRDPYSMAVMPYGGGRVVEVSEDGKLVMCTIDGWHRAFSIKYGELEEGEQRVTVLDELVTDSAPEGPVVWPLLDDEGNTIQEGGFFNGQDGRAFQSLEDQPDAPIAPRPTVIEPEEGAAYMFGSGMVLKYLLEAPPSDE